MERELIDKKEFDELNNKTLVNDSTIDDSYLIASYRFLKNKKVVDYHGIIECPEERYLYDALGRTYRMPKYPKAVEDFIKSEFLSNELKSKILTVIDNVLGLDNINELLKSDKNINDFCDMDLSLINMAINSRNKNKKTLLPEIFEKYVFALDGYGPTEFIRRYYSKKELAKQFLVNSGLASGSIYYVGTGVNRKYLNEEHLLSIYSKYEKYFPEEKDKFIDMIKHTKTLSAQNFVANYISFVSNDFTCNEFKDDVLKVDSVEEEKLSNDIRKKFLSGIHKRNKILKRKNHLL